MTNFNYGLPPIKLGRGDQVALDLEIVGQQEPLHVPTGDLAIAAVAFKDEAWVITELADLRRLIPRIRQAEIVGQNFLYDIRHLKRWGIDTSEWRIWDTMLADQMIFGGYYSHFDLNALSRRHLREYMGKEVREEFPDLQRSQIGRRHLEYAARDAINTLRIAQRQQEIMEPDEVKNYWLIEEPMIHAVLDMPGPRIDVDAWVSMVKDFEVQAEAIRQELGFNFRSHLQVKPLLEKRLKVKLKDTKEATLAAHANDPLVARILKGREYATLVSTYGANWIEQHIRDEDGLKIVRPNWKIIGTDTDRMACTDPNMQNIPVREHPEYRKCVIARPGHVFSANDAKGQELLCIAYMSGDERLIGMIRAGIDPYVEVAMGVLGANDRRSGKSILLGLDYGMTAYGLAPRLKCSVEDAERYINKFYRMFPGIRSFLVTQRNKAGRFGYVRDSLNGKTHINSYSRQRDNNAVNAPIQRTAALLTKRAVGLQWKYSREMGLDFYTVLAVHDETDGDVPKKLLKTYQTITRRSWEDAASLVIPGMPMRLDMSTGPNWGCKH